ncbi:DUF5665 domain-containing protein [Ovoidimarina sediminis]|uniref:DUF5665 domain-containing protein n=1 Tax=Ovoidimarina sediminis TaxID=3079856 RepID=UPI00290C70A7|nr:DUF5665 domain-containing protein [Rhodophyticola sp. MJ-SS7]MDU8943823.1 DUF5665 domain-containing protein [Rhodophyticola sp. MJ-SS7]
MEQETDSDFAALRDEIRGLRAEVKRLNDHRFIKVQNSTRRMLTFMLLRGLALGLGTVIGASVLVSVLAFVLAQINFIPIVGEWAQDFARQIEAELAANRGEPPPVEGEANPDGSIAPKGDGQ